MAFAFSRSPTATFPMISPYPNAAFLSSSGMSSLQYAGKHFETPTHEQLNSPMIHFSSSAGVPSGDARMKSPVHHSGIGSFGKPSAGMTLSMSSVKNFVVKFENFGSSGP